MKIKMTYGKCHIAVQGFEIECPFCKVLVKSGQMHDCSPATIDVPKRKRKQARP